jgi:MoxR-like ATPase
MNEPTMTTTDATAQAERFREIYTQLSDTIHQAFVGQQHLVDDVLAAFLVGGHVLIEGVPGLGKTLLVRTLAAAVDVDFSRIQFTPDLMPADITGTMVLHETEGGGHTLRFEPGPIVANIVLADEINRATPKTQAALLEAMQERQVSAARQTIPLPEPFIVLATQNPVEQEGTYPLPEAQLDRFLMKLLVEYPSEDEALAIMDLTTTTQAATITPVTSGVEILTQRQVVRAVACTEPITRYAIRLARATQPTAAEAPPLVRQSVALGASPRGVQAMILLGKVRALRDGRFAVSAQDIRGVARQTLRHRLMLTFEAQAQGTTADQIIASALEATSELPQ